MLGLEQAPSTHSDNAWTTASRRKPRTLDVAAIEAMDREECIERWRELFGVMPPKYTSLEFMRKAIAYEVQVKAFGGHSNVVQRALKASLKTVRSEVENGRAADGEHCARITDVCLSGSEPEGLIEGLARNALQTIRPTKPSVLSIRAGTHLVREWSGRTYQVEALEKGFRLDGKTYRSLSAIAKKITGAHWSGPRFFGLES